MNGPDAPSSAGPVENGGEPEVRRLTIASNELEAELVCGMLRNEGIICTHRITNFAFGSGGELPQSGAGPREVLVHEPNLARARELLDGLSAAGPDV